MDSGVLIYAIPLATARLNEYVVNIPDQVVEKRLPASNIAAIQDLGPFVEQLRRIPQVGSTKIYDFLIDVNCDPRDPAWRWGIGFACNRHDWRMLGLPDDITSPGRESDLTACNYLMTFFKQKELIEEGATFGWYINFEQT